MNPLAAVADAAAGIEPAPDTLAELTGLLKLSSVGLTIVRAVVHGHGSKASATLHYNDGNLTEFDTLKDLATPQKLMVEIIATTGAMPKLKPADAHRALMLLRSAADHQDVMSQDDISIDLGMTFLQSAEVIDVDMSDRSDRWGAFSFLNDVHPGETSKLEGKPYATACYTLRDKTGNRYVRCGWFFGHCRDLDRGVSQSELAHRMERVGWERRGRRGAIKASAPARDAFLSWSFYVIPAGWNDTPVQGDPGCLVVAGYTSRAHVKDLGSSRVGEATGDNQEGGL